MPKQISSLSVGLFGDVGHFAKAFGQQAVSGVKSFTSSIASAGGTLLKFTGIGAALAVGQQALNTILAAPGEALTAARRQVEAETRLAAVLKATGGAAGFSADQLKAHAAALQGATTFGDEAVLEFQAVLATFRNVAGDSFKQATELALDMATVMGTDLNSAGVQLGKALNDPKEGISALTRVGVSFTEQQKAQIKAMQDAGNMAGAQKVILDELRGEFGGAAAAMAKTPFGRMTQLWNAFGDTMEQVGSIFATVITGIFDAFNIGGAIGGFSSALSKAQAAVTGFVGRAVPVLQSVVAMIRDGFTNAYNYVAPVLGRIGAVVGFLFNGMVAVVTPRLASLWATVQSVFQGIYDFVAPIVTRIYGDVAANWEAIVSTVTAYDLAILGVVQAVWGVIVQVAQGIWEAVVAVWQWGSELITGHTVSAGDAINGSWDGIVSGAKWLADQLTLAFNVASYAITHWKDGLEIVGTEATLAIVRFANQAIYFFTEAIPYAAGYLSRNWKEIFEDLGNWTTLVIGNLANNIVNVFSKLPDLIKGKVNFADLWTPLTNGFQSAVKESFVLPDRVQGDFEKQLEGQAKALEDAYGKGLGEHLAAKDTEAKAAAKGINDGIKAALAPGKVEAPKVDAPKIPDVEIGAKLNPDNLALTVTPKAKAVRAGSAEAQLLRLAVPQATPLQSLGMANVGKEMQAKQFTELQKQTLLQQKIADQTRTPAVVTF